MANQGRTGMPNKEDSWLELEELIKYIGERQYECIVNSKRLRNFPSFRQITFGSNSYYLAVMTRYLQLLCSIQYKANLEQFISDLQILDAGNFEDQPIKYKQSIKALRDIAEEINSSDEAIRLDSFIGIQSKEDVKNILAESARFITYSALRKEFGNDEHGLFPNIAEVMMEGGLGDNQEAEGLIFTYLSIGLRCTVNQYIFFGTIVKQTFSAERNIGGHVFDIKSSDQGTIEINNRNRIAINILRRSNQYYLLYSAQDIESEQWSTAEHKYYIRDAIQANKKVFGNLEKLGCSMLKANH